MRLDLESMEFRTVCLKMSVQICCFLIGVDAEG